MWFLENRNQPFVKIYTHLFIVEAAIGIIFAQSLTPISIQPIPQFIYHRCRIPFNFHLLGFICTFPLEKLQCENNYSHNKVATTHRDFRFMVTSTSTCNWLHECVSVNVNVSVGLRCLWTMYVLFFVFVCVLVWNFSVMSIDAWNSALLNGLAFNCEQPEQTHH